MNASFHRLPDAAIAALALLIAPTAQATEPTLAGPVSPYRLEAGFARMSALVMPSKQYLLEPRYRLQSASNETAAAPRPARPFASEIDAAAREAEIDPDLVHALIEVESNYRPAATSPKGARGLMQVMPETARRYGVGDPAGISGNLRAGTRHLRYLMGLFDNQLELVLAAYNAGEGAVTRYKNTIPPYPETRHYVPAVIGKYKIAETTRVAANDVKPTAINYLPGTRLDISALKNLP
jgi:soluble lytic murein transglycosylase-like protein